MLSGLKKDNTVCVRWLREIRALPYRFLEKKQKVGQNQPSNFLCCDF